jgi:hypothetical protein
MVGSIYAVCALVLTLLINAASQEHHDISGDQDVFRFPKVLKIALMIGTPVAGALGFAIWPTFGPSRGVVEACFLVFIFGSITLITGAVYIQTVRFAAVLGRQGMDIHAWWSSRSVRFADVHRILIVWPWRGRGHLSLYDGSDNQLCRLDGGLQDFEDLVALVEARCPRGTPVREKDTDGKWSEWTTEGSREA